MEPIMPRCWIRKVFFAIRVITSVFMIAGIMVYTGILLVSLFSGKPFLMFASGSFLNVANQVLGISVIMLITVNAIEPFVRRKPIGLMAFLNAILGMFFFGFILAGNINLHLDTFDRMDVVRGIEMQIADTEQPERIKHLCELRDEFTRNIGGSWIDEMIPRSKKCPDN